MTNSLVAYDPSFEEFQRKEKQQRADMFCQIMHYFMTERARRESSYTIRVKEPSKEPPIKHVEKIFPRRPAPPSMTHAGPRSIRKKKKPISKKFQEKTSKKSQEGKVTKKPRRKKERKLLF
jgi:hypothetical protein